MSKSKAVAVLALAAVAALGAAWLFPSPPEAPVPENAGGHSLPQEAAKPLQADLPPNRPPDLPALAARLGAGVLPPTAEQIEEERRVEREQVAEAMHSLRSPEVEERIGAVQQLAAYPTREAELQLERTLAGDSAAAVREAAALGLAYFRSPDSRTIEALLQRMLDASPDVRDAALQTLEGYLNGLDAASEPFRRIRKGLSRLAKSGKLAPETRRGVRELLTDIED